MSSSTNDFYERIAGFVDFSEFTQTRWYTPLPSEWLVVISDVQGSTAAIQVGKYREVNSIGVASIVAVLNSVVPIKIPYIFGGDGATFCIPPAKSNEVASALVAAKQMAEKSFRMKLRIGMVPMSLILRDGHQILVGKYQISSSYQQAMFMGGGLGYAESLVKNPNPENPYLISENQIEPYGNFVGFHCRWNEIPSRYGENVAILVRALEQTAFSKEEIYSEVLQKITEIYGNEGLYHPIRQELLSLASSFRKLSSEVRILTAFQPPWKRWVYFLKLRLIVFVGKWLLNNNVKTKNVDWGRYKQILVANTDYRKFDELLRMIIAGTPEQRIRLRDFLERLRKEGKIVYGMHSDPSALLTCMIFNRDTDHIHFLDGSNGGYALAAKELKENLKELSN